MQRRSLQLSDKGSRQSRGQLFQARLAEKSPWLTRVAQDFDLRRYAFDTTLRPIKAFEELTLDGQASAMQGSLTALAERFRGQPIAGILLFTDGNATDLAGALDWSRLPPVYPVLPAASGTRSLMGFAGYACALASDAAARKNAQTRKRRLLVIMASSLGM